MKKRRQVWKPVDKELSVGRSRSVASIPVVAQIGNTSGVQAYSPQVLEQDNLPVSASSSAFNTPVKATTTIGDMNFEESVLRNRRVGTPFSSPTREERGRS